MTDQLRKAAEMALEALNKRINGDFDGSTYTDIEYMASEALRTALAQPEQEHFCDTHCVHTDHHPDCELAPPKQEPVAWGYRYRDGEIRDCICPEAHAENEGEYTIPLYTAPPKRVWQGLTDEERVQAFVDAGLELAYMDYDADMKISKVIEAKLKERNT